MKKIFKILSGILLVAGATMFISCSDDDDDDSKTSYTVTYVTEIGTAPNAITVDEGTVLSDAQLPTLSDSDNEYKFGGWYIYTGTDASKKIVAGQYTVKGDVTLGAVWTYTVMLDPNGGSGSSGSFQASVTRPYTYKDFFSGKDGSSTTVDYVTIPTASDCGISKSGYTFVCWNDKEDGTGTSYRADEKFMYSLWESKSSKITRLYAVWRESSSNLKIATINTLETVLPKLESGDTLIYLGETPYTSGYDSSETMKSERTLIETYLKDENKQITLDLSYHTGYFRETFRYAGSYSGLFEECTSIRKVIISKIIYKVGYVNDYSRRIFYNCKNLSEVEFADTIESIPHYAFCYCSLTSLTLPKNLKYIHKYAFYGNNFTSVTISNNDTYIGDKAFSESVSIKREGNS